jgi:hypothetical protein
MDEKEDLILDAALDEDRNPEYPDPFPTESQVMAAVAKAEYDAMTPDKQAEVDARWDALPEWRKQEIRAEVEFDLL